MEPMIKSSKHKNSNKLINYNKKNLISHKISQALNKNRKLFKTLKKLNR